MLPGITVAGAGSYRPADLEKIDTTTSASSSNTLSNKIEYGDLLILIYGGNSITPAAPSGWTAIKIVGASGWDAAHGLFYKIADGTEAGASLTTGGNSSIVHVVRNAGPIASIGTPSTASDISNGNPSAVTASATGISAPAIALGCSSTSFGTPSMYDPLTTPAFDQENTVNRICAGITVYDSGETPVDQGADNLDEGAANGISAAIFEVN